MESNHQLKLNRRQFFLRSAITAGGIITTNLVAKSQVFAQAPGIITSDTMRSAIPYGVATGDITNNNVVIWSKSDRPAKMIVEYSTSETFSNVQRILGPNALENSDFTARINLRNLPPNQQIFYRVLFQNLDYQNTYSAPVSGTFRTPPTFGRDILFVWGGDTAGQGWGINPDFGGMKIYETMRQLNPDFFIHSGDNIYADGPIQSQVSLGNGNIWRNITTEEKSKVAETLKEFRGNYIYNLLDENVRRFNAEVPMLAQWDDHEVTNNWYPGEILNDSRYTVKDVNLLAQRGRQAFLEYMPIEYATNNTDQARIYRSFNYGPALDIFMLDERTYRGRNTPNRQPTASKDTQMLGVTQVQWLKRQLLTSKSTWKVIASDMPLGLIVRDGSTDFEAWANGDGPALGRELELADLLRFIKNRNIKNVVWLTADVHYAAAHYYDPNKAQFQDFKPFWEFVAGPLNAGTFGPNQLENTFGPQLVFQSLPPGTSANRPPSEGLQFFGAVKINALSKVMTVSLRNLAGDIVYSVDLPPEA
ncbi:Twin-arginine translocation pathway signal [Trichormus variabilis ATCC 29413]|uniref:Twin-arginine translocation pathway signal n=2 Tax=Anabaena variabilis TaxID=264691 RepID=Q3M9M5_TRIV2|nr:MULTISPECIES: alkaline phosphatase [Nostocaceae]ABA22311.1 Twin-arginine translocation pathway signal [Trichormus variabilis ATCC 29413]MBC1217428.1 alkaline phosphatase [Trichormus variabilis ARAD]MBC1256716.1 alkaline phosphatase [Trichormus variabilis V5]MBC1268183.1 alkaline phosphatase [Trichormus variabilis FSR]MBC1301826.1 alkaline phosphatase [Trichormus variabilis N2B]